MAFSKYTRQTAVKGTEALSQPASAMTLTPPQRYSQRYSSGESMAGPPQGRHSARSGTPKRETITSRSWMCRSKGTSPLLLLSKSQPPWAHSGRADSRWNTASRGLP